MDIAGKHILLILTGGIAAYKGLDLIRQVQKAGGTCQAILTDAATHFVSPLSVATLTGRPALRELFDLTRESEIGHIELSRSADLIVVAPASADFLAKMAHGLADDLASTTCLATDTDILVAPAMNVRMWNAAPTRRNVEQLRAEGVRFAGPDEGEMACGEFGPGRMAEPQTILAAIAAYFAGADRPLKGRHIVVTSGPTREAIDPVRYISNASSGKQGRAIAEGLIALGADVSFITGPAETPPPDGCRVIRVTTALEMSAAVMNALPADAAIFCAAVADWRVVNAQTEKYKKTADGGPPVLEFAPNPDILANVAHLPKDERPRLVVGFAAETGDLLPKARAKLETKNCDWLLANDVSAQSGVFGGANNRVLWLNGRKEEDWGSLPKSEVGRKLAARIAAHLTSGDLQ